MAITALGVCASSASAQRRDSYRGPANWISLSSGILLLNGVRDGRTQSVWGFGNAYPMRLSLERDIGGGNSIGAQFSYVRAPLVYRSQASCGTCNAHATIATYGPMLRLGGSGGTFHEVLEAFAGVLQYGNFTTDDGNITLPPTKPDRDFAFSFNIGVGYSMRRDLAVDVTLAQLRVLHQRTNLPNDAQTLTQHTGVLVAVRMGF